MPIIIQLGKQKKEPEPKQEPKETFPEFAKRILPPAYRVNPTLLSMILWQRYNITDQEFNLVGFLYVDDTDVMGGVYDVIRVVNPAFLPEAEKLATAFEEYSGCESIAIFVNAQ